MTFAAETNPFIFGYKSGAPIISVSTTNQSDYTEVADYDDSLLGLEIINGTIYGLSCDHYFYTSKLVILNPDFTIRNTVGSWFNDNFVITDTAVQNGTLWGTYNDENADSYLIPISLTTGQPETAGTKKITGLPAGEIIYTIACNAAGQMYAIVADGGDNGGAATLYTIDTSNGAATEVGSTGVTTNFISSSAFAPDGTLYWAENKDSKLYTVNTSSGRATAVPGGTIGGRGFVLNAMMIPSDADTTAYVNFVVNGEGTVTMDGKEVSGCISRLDFGKKYCHQSPTMDEKPLQDAIMQAVMKVVQTNPHVLQTLKMHIQMGLGGEAGEDESMDIQIRIAQIDKKFKDILNSVTAENQQSLLADPRIGELMSEKRILENRLAEYAAAEQKRADTESRLANLYTILEGMKNHPMEYDDRMIRKILRCVVVQIKQRIKVIFIDGLEMEVEVEQ